MEGQISYSSLLVISVTAFITPFLVSKLKRVKIPYQVGEIIIGVIVGKTFLNLINIDTTVIFLSNLGLSYLMFLSGLEVNLSDFNTKQNDKSFITTPLKMAVTALIVSFLLCISALKLIGITKGSLLFTLIFVASAPGLVLPVLKGKNMLKSPFGKFILSFSIICEFLSLIGITIIFAISENGFSFKSFEFLLIFLCAGLLYLLGYMFTKRHDILAPSYKNIHLIVRAAFALILMLVAIAQKLNTEIVLGSFLAGMIFSVLIGKAREEVSHQLDVIGYGFLIPIFFIMVGAKIDLKIILTDPSIILKVLVINLIFFAVKLVPSIFLVNKFSKKEIFGAAIILSPQLSLLIVAAQMALDSKYINVSDYSAFIITTIVSCIIFPLLFDKLVPAYDKETSKDSEMVVREVVFTNEELVDKPLCNCSFPASCRIFSVIRNEKEFLPNANTRLQNGDIIVLVGERDEVYKTINKLT